MTTAATKRATPGPAPHTAEYRRRGWWRDETFLDDLHRQAQIRPHKLAIAGRRIAESRTDTLDYAELARLTDRFALALLELGVRRGDFVAVQLPNQWEMVALMFACMRVGAVICPMSPVCPEDELRHRLGLTEARVCVTLPEWSGTPLAEIVTGLKDELPPSTTCWWWTGRPRRARCPSTNTSWPRLARSTGPPTWTAWR